MKNYINLLVQVLNEGQWQGNRTGIPTKRMDGAMLQFDLREGFPAITTKKLAFGQVKGELIGFIRGYRTAEQFRRVGCKVWDQNANENKAWLENENRRGTDDLGRIYGVQWRQWAGAAYIDHHDSFVSKPKIDQLENAINLICDDPTNRRIIVTAWNPAEMDRMALPPCHLLYQFFVDVETNVLSMCMYQRSCDLFLGIPFNIASYALLLELVAAATGRIAGKLTMFLADVHIYKNHIEQVEEQIEREPLPLPKLHIDVTNPEILFADRINFMNLVRPEHITLQKYAPHPAIKGDMAV